MSEGLFVPSFFVQVLLPFYPSFYGFIRDKEHWPSLDMQPQDYGLGKSPSAPEPKGSPKWEHRDSPKGN